MNARTPLRLWLWAGVPSVALAAVTILLFARTVEANTLLPQAYSTVPVAVPVTGVTPASLAPLRTNDPLHGFASWYGGVFNGRKTASGEIYNMYGMTACHPTLPFGSVVRVKNVRNKKTVVVRITDRGYLYEGRVIDLSYAAAKQLGMIKPGLAPVDLEVLSWGKPLERQ